MVHIKIKKKKEIFFKTTHVYTLEITESNARLNNYSKLKESREKRQLSEIHDFGLDSKLKKKRNFCWIEHYYSTGYI